MSCTNALNTYSFHSIIVEHINYYYVINIVTSLILRYLNNHNDIYYNKQSFKGIQTKNNITRYHYRYYPYTFLATQITQLLSSKTQYYYVSFENNYYISKLQYYRKTIIAYTIDDKPTSLDKHSPFSSFVINQYQSNRIWEYWCLRVIDCFYYFLLHSLSNNPYSSSHTDFQYKLYKTQIITTNLSVYSSFYTHYKELTLRILHDSQMNSITSSEDMKDKWMKTNSYFLEKRPSTLPLNSDYYSMFNLWIRIGSIHNGTENDRTAHIMIFRVSTFHWLLPLLLKRRLFSSWMIINNFIHSILVNCKELSIWIEHY